MPESEPFRFRCCGAKVRLTDRSSEWLVLFQKICSLPLPLENEGLWNGPPLTSDSVGCYWAVGGERFMALEIAVLGIDLGKNSCSLVGLDEAGAALRRPGSRRRVGGPSGRGFRQRRRKPAGRRRRCSKAEHAKERTVLSQCMATACHSLSRTQRFSTR